jgi:hypothetical protein
VDGTWWASAIFPFPGDFVGMAFLVGRRLASSNIRLQDAREGGV